MANFMIAQDKQHDGLPYHDAQGDSTWDALHFKGPSPYSGALTISAWAAMADGARQRGDGPQAERFAERLARAQQSFEKYFWNGRLRAKRAAVPHAGGVDRRGHIPCAFEPPAAGQLVLALARGKGWRNAPIGFADAS